MKQYQKTILSNLLLIMFMHFSIATKAMAAEWEFLYQEGDIKVYEKPGNLPAYKAEGKMQLNLYEVLAILADMPRRVEWVHNLKEIKIIKGDPESHVLVYNLFDLPWPASDRDSIVEGFVNIDYQKLEVEIITNNTNHNSEPKREGVVRIPKVYGRTHLIYIDDYNIWVTYEIMLNPGGYLPNWIAKIFVKDVPVKTIRAIREQVIKTKGEYNSFIERHQRLARESRIKK